MVLFLWRLPCSCVCYQVGVHKHYYHRTCRPGVCDNALDKLCCSRSWERAAKLATFGFTRFPPEDELDAVREFFRRAGVEEEPGLLSVTFHRDGGGLLRWVAAADEQPDRAANTPR